MLKKEFLIYLLAALFCLGLTGMAMAGEDEEIPFDQTFTETTHPMTMNVEHGQRIGMESHLTPENTMQAENKNKSRVVCATYANLEVEYDNNGRPCSGS